MSAASLKAAGAEVVAATSSDPRFPAGAAIDGCVAGAASPCPSSPATISFNNPRAVCRDEKTFWLTTGLFPQELVIALPKTQSLTQIRTRTRSGQLRVRLRDRSAHSVLTCPGPKKPRNSLCSAATSLCLRRSSRLSKWVRIARSFVSSTSAHCAFCARRRAARARRTSCAAGGGFPGAGRRCKVSQAHHSLCLRRFCCRSQH